MTSLVCRREIPARDALTHNYHNGEITGTQVIFPFQVAVLMTRRRIMMNKNHESLFVLLGCVQVFCWANCGRK